MSRNARFILNIVIVVAVVALLAGGVYFLTRPEEGDSLGEMYTDDDKVKVFSYAADELTGVQVTNQYGSYSLSREGGAWSMAGMEGETLNATALDTLVFTFMNITSDAKVAEAGADMSVYGLDAPTAVLTLTTAGGGRTFYIGSQTPDASGSYFNTDASEDVYIMKSYMVDVVELTARDYLTVAEGLSAESITAVTVDGPSGRLAVEMRPEGPRDQYGLLSYWNLTSPERRSASNSDVTDRLLTPISQLESGVSGVLEMNDENLSSTGLNSPEYTVSVTAGGGDVVYEFSPVSGEYRYFRRSDVNYIMRTDSEDCAFLQTGSYDVAEKLLAMIDIALISEIRTSHDGREKQFDIVDGGGDNAAFYKDGVQLDADEFRDFYGKIVAIAVSGVPDGPADYSQPPAPEGSIEYVLTDGTGLKLEFTGYDERNCLVSVDGEEYYTVARKTVDKMFEEIDKAFE